MTFQKAQEIFATKYPDGELVQHGKFGGTAKNKKITVIFHDGGRCYEYYGAYEDVLCRIGFKVISKERYEETKRRLETCQKLDGTEGFFGEKVDYTDEIIKYTRLLAEYEANWIIA